MQFLLLNVRNHKLWKSSFYFHDTRKYSQLQITPLYGINILLIQSQVHVLAEVNSLDPGVSSDPQGMNMVRLKSRPTRFSVYSGMEFFILLS